ncbi:MAG: DUF1513 domain-containing protein [Hyphomicrobiaceae bacterium]
MGIDRRAALAAMIGGAATAAWPKLGCAETGRLFAAARRGPDGRFSAAIFSHDGKDVTAVVLPGRGHDVAVSPVSGRCVAFARRPGNFAVAFSAYRGEAPVVFETPADRHFYGHGVFSPDGRLLYTTENDFEGRRGVIGVYDATGGFYRVGEFASHGIGPHDLAFLAGSRVMVVANGGLREHPDIGGGRRVLNLEAVETSLAYIDVTTGALLEKHAIPAGGALSLRHLEVGENNTVVLGAQIVRGVPGGQPLAEALIYRHRRQAALVATPLSDEAAAALSGYVSSVAVDSSGTIAAATSSKGGAVVMLDVASGRVLGIEAMRDVSGVTKRDAAGGFLVTSGVGVIADVAATHRSVTPTAESSWNWDNHAVRVDI